MINREQLTGTLRILVPALVTLATALGLKSSLDSDTWVTLVTAVVTAGSIVWTLFAHTNSAKISSVASIDPNVRVFVPQHVIQDDSKVAALVQDATVPNVVRAL